MPASLVRTMDSIVFERKRPTRGYNRSALIQEAVAAFLQAQEREAGRLGASFEVDIGSYRCPK